MFAKYLYDYRWSDRRIDGRTSSDTTSYAHILPNKNQIILHPSINIYWWLNCTIYSHVSPPEINNRVTNENKSNQYIIDFKVIFSEEIEKTRGAGDPQSLPKDNVMLQAIFLFSRFPKIFWCYFIRNYTSRITMQPLLLIISNLTSSLITHLASDMKK